MDYRRVAKKVQEKVSLVAEMEGAYGTADGQMIHILQDLLNCKYAIDVAYRSFSDRIRGPYRDAVVDHWKDHAKEERQGSYDLAMKIVGMGADPIVTVVSVPQCPANIEAFGATLIHMELDLINKARELIDCCGENTSMRVLAENIVLIDTHHLDDLRRMFGNHHG